MNKASDELCGLILSALYGAASPEQQTRLAEILEGDEEARRTYVDFLIMYTHLYRRKGASLFIEPNESILNENAWEILARQEKTAEPVPVERPVEKPKPQAPPRAPAQTQVSRLSIYLLALSSAALFFLIAYAHFSPTRVSMPMGKLTRTVAAQWQNASGQIVEGCDLYAGPMHLTQGYAEIVLEGGAAVIVEAPCLFAIESAQQVFVREGQIVAKMDGSSGQAFVVRTPHASVVDYGTEFGVRVDSAGQTETYVYEGLVHIRDSSDPVKFSQSLFLKAGQGAVADAQHRLMSKLINPHSFARPEELTVRSQARKSNGYYRWRSSIYRLHRDPSLAAHYFFEKAEDNPQRLINAVASAGVSSQGRFGDEGRTAPTWTQGRWPQKDAVLFERDKRQVIVIDPDPTLSLASPLTLSAWVLFPNAGQWGGHLISCRQHHRINYQFSLFDDSYAYNYQKNRFEFRQYDGAGSAGLYSETFVPSGHTWYHFTVVYTGSEIRFYVNGALFQAAPYQGLPEAAPAEIILGAMKIEDYVLQEGDFDGVVDELLIFSRDLSEQEIRTIYEDGKP